MDKLVKLSEDWGFRLEEGLKFIGIDLTSEIRGKVLKHLALIVEECQRTNLVSHGDREFLIERHVLPSLAALPFIENAPLETICIGSGAGFPGVDIKIFRPGLRLTLLEATKKKADFLFRVVKELELRKVEVLWERAENLKQRTFDVALARGVAPMAKLEELAAPLLKEGGQLIAWKGSKFHQEMTAVKKPLFRVENVYEYDPPRILVVLRKI